MRVTVWISEETLKEINTGEPITGRIYMREPGKHVNVLQVQVSEDEYYEMIDRQVIDTEPTMDNADLAGTGYWWRRGPAAEPEEQPLPPSFRSEHEKKWECSLPEGAEWDVEYSITDENKDK